eukprot:1930197-Prymnesium_polylepis.1
MIRDVRIVEGADDTLLSVRQLWIQQHWDCRFGESNTVHVVQSNDEYPFAFSRQTGLYDWPVVLGASGSFTPSSDSPDTPAWCFKASSIHRAHSTAH